MIKLWAISYYPPRNALIQYGINCILHWACYLAGRIIRHCQIVNNVKTLAKLSTALVNLFMSWKSHFVQYLPILQDRQRPMQVAIINNYILIATTYQIRFQIKDVMLNKPQNKQQPKDSLLVCPLCIQTLHKFLPNGYSILRSSILTPPNTTIYHRKIMHRKHQILQYLTARCSVVLGAYPHKSHFITCVWMPQK